MKKCLVTISDAQFSIATEVLLYSFHKYNPDFDGDVIVISDQLPQKHRERLQAISPVRFVEPDCQLRDAVERLQGEVPRLSDIYRRLFSLDIFRLSEYDRVVYLDSDIYCAGDISALFSRSEPLLACPDGFTYGDWIEDALGDRCGKPAASVRYGRVFSQSFNAGVLSIGPPVLGKSCYEALLEWLQPKRWHSMAGDKFSDQLLLNIHFDGAFTPLEACYNYMVFLEGYQKCCDTVSFLDARLVHFAGALKPWLDYDMELLARRAPQFIKFFDAWRELLEEARCTADPASRIEVTRDRYQRQKQWIAQYNSAPIESIGRLY